MKKLMLAVLLLFWSTQVFAAGSTSTVVGSYGNIRSEQTDAYQVSFTQVADAADASFPEVLITKVGGSLTGVYIDEGTTPTDGTISVSVKPYGTDINLLGANGAVVNTVIGYATIPPAATVTSDLYLADFIGNLTFQITGGGVNSANPRVILTFRR